MALVLFAAFPDYVLAQGSVKNDRLEVSLRETKKLDRSTSNNAPLDTVTVTGKPRIELTAGTEGQEAKIVYGDFAKQRWQLKFSAPIDEDGGEGTFADLDGLANATRITWEGRHYRLASGPQSEAEILRPKCAELRTLLRNLTPDEASPLAEFRSRVDPNGSGFCLSNWFYEVQAFLSDPKLNVAAPRLKEISDDVISKFEGQTWINILAFKASGGIRSYDFINIDATTASKQSVEEDVYSAEVTSSWSKAKVVVLTVGARWENTTNGNDSGTVCPASTAGEPVTCLTGAIGAPENVEKSITFAEAHWAPNGGSRGFAISPRISYEVDKGVLGINVPVYLLLSNSDDDDDQSFVGGIRLGWTDEEDELIASIFVGKKFDLTEN